jgi:hypothetical protein
MATRLGVEINGAGTIKAHQTYTLLNLPTLVRANAVLMLLGQSCCAMLITDMRSRASVIW